MRCGLSFRHAHFPLAQISMLSGEFFDLLHRSVKRARGDESRPFGGIQMILSGDFHQLPAIPPRFGMAAPAAGAFTGRGHAYQSDAWHELRLQYCFLSGNRRAGGDADFAALLGRVRRGEATEADANLLNSRAPDMGGGCAGAGGGRGGFSMASSVIVKQAREALENPVAVMPMNEQVNGQLLYPKPESVNPGPCLSLNTQTLIRKVC